MADEIKLNVSLTYAKNRLSVSYGDQLAIDVAGEEHTDNVQSVGTSNEPLDFGDTNPGYVIIQNLDATNYVEVFGDALDAELHDKLLPGDVVVRRLDGATSLYAKSNTAACRVLVIGIDL